jgi:hypothetical protein
VSVEPVPVSCTWLNWTTKLPLASATTRGMLSEDPASPFAIVTVATGARSLVLTFSWIAGFPLPRSNTVLVTISPFESSTWFGYPLPNW